MLNEISIDRDTIKQWLEDIGFAVTDDECKTIMDDAEEAIYSATYDLVMNSYIKMVCEK